MFWELFRFELYYRRRRATTYVYFIVIFLTSFVTITSPTLSVTGTSDATSANAPYTIAVLMVVLSFLFTLITSSLVGVAVIRDVEHDMAPIIFTTPIHKGSYLFGRFAGSLVILILLNTGIIFGALLAYLIGSVLPWEITWYTKEILPFNAWTYIQPFLIFSVSNIFITGSLFFAAGALVRKPMIVYSQGIALVMLYQLANIFYLRDMDSQHIAALVDPFGVQTFVYMTRYWTSLEQNTMLVPLEGTMLYNRLIWTTIAIAVLGITYWRFSFTSRRGFISKRKKIVESNDPVPVIGPIPQVIKTKGLLSDTRQLVSSVLFHFRAIWTEIPFMAIAGTGLLVLFVNSARMTSVLGTNSYPTTPVILTMLGSFSLFFIILMIFYSGEIVWKERQYKIQSIIDTAPVSNSIIVLSKLLCMFLVYLTLLTGFFLYGILLQSAYGYYEYDFKAYFGTLSETFINLSLVTVVSILIQTISGNKFLGFVGTVVFALFVALLPLFGVEHEIFIYGSGSLGTFSQMNGFGHFIVPFIWLKTYWIALASVFFILAVILYRRSVESNIRTKWKIGSRQLSPALKVTGIAAIILFSGCGSYIYYNTSVVNHFQNPRAIKAAQPQKDEEMKHLASDSQPAIVEVNLVVEILPQQRSLKAKGFYYLKNVDSVALSSIQLRYLSSSHFHLNKVSFERNSSLTEERPPIGYRAYSITPPLSPGDSLRMDFDVDFTHQGFESKPQDTDIVYNGTFFRNDYFPLVGFNKSPDRVRFSAVISTDSSQSVIAPGRVVKEWYEKNRHYYQYASNSSIPNSYAIVSGRYQLKKEKWNDIDLEIYYHASHGVNVPRMMQSMKDGLDYYTKNFNATSNDPVRIIEIPGYSTRPQSLPGVIALPETAGFVLKVKDPAKDIDVPYYVAAHELAHLWWGQDVISADSPGDKMLSEGLAQYSALMVMKRSYSPEIMHLFLKYELDSYVKGRTQEKKKEVPLVAVGDQQYISHNKSALAFFALQDYIGEEKLNEALRSFHEKWARKDGRPASNALVEEIAKVTPDSLSYLIGDLFQHITAFENTASEAAYSVVAGDRYEVTINLSTEKLQADASGLEKPIPINDWIDVGVYTEDANGAVKLSYLRKHKFTRKKTTLTISLREKPVKVGIDPLNKLIDHHSNDNVIPVVDVVDLTNSPIGN